MTGYIVGLEEAEAKLHRQRRLFLMRWNPNISTIKEPISNSILDVSREMKK